MADSSQLSANRSLDFGEIREKQELSKLGCSLKYQGLATKIYRKAESDQGTHTQSDSAGGTLSLEAFVLVIN